MAVYEFIIAHELPKINDTIVKFVKFITKFPLYL